MTAAGVAVGTVAPMAIIRALAEPDLPAVFEALAEAGEQAYSGDPTTLAQHLAAVMAGDGAAVITTDVFGTLLGAAIVRASEPGVCELVVVWVTESHRRRGLARAMLSALTPVWATSTIAATVPPRAQTAEAVGGLLSQFAFTPVKGTEPPQWRTRRVRRTTGRASLAPLG